MKRQTQGFTLLELLMVVIIIGILAAVAVPQYLKSTEKSRMSEAITILGQIRSSNIRYYAENPVVGYATILGQMDFDPMALNAVSGTLVFNYLCTGGGVAFDCTATRRGVAADLAGTGCVTGYKVHITNTGAITGRDCQTT